MHTDVHIVVIKTFFMFYLFCNKTYYHEHAFYVFLFFNVFKLFFCKKTDIYVAAFHVNYVRY